MHRAFEESAEPSDEKVMMARVYIALAGSLLILLLASAMLLALFGASTVWIVSVFVVAAAVIVQAIARAAFGPMYFVQALAWVMGGLLASAAIGVVAMVPLVMTRTQTIAANAPSCIQVARGADYRPARSLLDLSGLVMLSSSWGGIAPQFHAVLVVESGDTPQLFNWSYRRLNWVRYISGPTPVIRCLARPELVKQLSLLPSMGTAETSNAYFRFRGRTFNIPAAYQPRASADSSPNLTILALAPAFTPSDLSCGGARDCIWQHVEIHFDPERVKSWLATQRADILEGDYGSGDRAVTRIYCWSPSYNGGLSCEHVFLHEGWVYRLNYSKDDLPQWRAMQDRLVRLVRSFQLARSD